MIYHRMESLIVETILPVARYFNSVILSNVGTISGKSANIGSLDALPASMLSAAMDYAMEAPRSKTNAP
jgi:hypothetical protein